METIHVKFKDGTSLKFGKEDFDTTKYTVHGHFSKICDCLCNKEEYYRSEHFWIKLSDISSIHLT